MAYSETLAERVRKILTKQSGIRERKMFGGLCFTLNGNMCCGIMEDHLVLRLGASEAEKALLEPHTRPMDFTGKPMKGMVYVEAEAIVSAPALRKWVMRSVVHAESLPPK
jgi:TfoX/Sxy family transcriptional regulator of competence genes